MEDVAPARKVSFNRWLPYWAVFQADMQQTVQSWVYRIWVLVSLLAPFAPHIAEELWERLGESGSVHTAPWPEAARPAG